MLDFKSFLMEQITGPQLASLASQISASIDHEHSMVNATIIRDITKSPIVTKLNPAGDDDGPGTFPPNLVKNLAANYRFYFGKIAKNFQHAEAILFEFPEYQTFIVYLGFLADGRKLAAFAVPPYYYVQTVRKKPIASSFPKITMILKSWGFKVHATDDKEEIASSDTDMDFFNKLIGIFRFISSRYFDFKDTSWNKAKQEFHKLTQEMPQAYNDYIKKLNTLYPDGVVARRKMYLQNDFLVHTIDGKKLPVPEVANKSIKVYYPNRNVMSQWTEDSMDPEEMDTAFGSGSGTSYIFKGIIPSNRIIYSQRVLPTGLTQLKVEGEIIVDHAPGSSGGVPPIDTNIICTVWD